jgi:hypothetical protein
MKFPRQPERQVRLLAVPHPETVVLRRAAKASAALMVEQPAAAAHTVARPGVVAPRAEQRAAAVPKRVLQAVVVRTVELPVAAVPRAERPVQAEPRRRRWERRRAQPVAAVPVPAVEQARYADERCHE